MSRIMCFEELELWKRARTLTAVVYRVTGTGAISRDFALRDQMRRSALSVMSNVAEGFERGGDRELHRFLVIAKGSAAELRAQLYAGLDIGALARDDFERLRRLCLEIGKMSSGLMRYLREGDGANLGAREAAFELYEPTSGA